MENTYYSVEELSEILKLHPKTVRRFIREGKITGRKIGRSWMVHEEELKRYMRDAVDASLKRLQLDCIDI